MNANIEVRILNRALARELTAEEINEVSGGGTLTTTSCSPTGTGTTKCPVYGADDEPA